MDMVNKPPHYESEHYPDCIEYTKHMDFACGNAFKYIYRNGNKENHSQKEDFKKANWYLNIRDVNITNHTSRIFKYQTNKLFQHDNYSILASIIEYCNYYDVSDKSKAMYEISRRIKDMEV
jgi:hypothetical protein